MRLKAEKLDKLTKEERSQLMARVKSKNTKPEIIVRKLLFSHGYRYRLHRKNLPGSPDVVFPGRRKVIFVHGCFWHRHQNCKFSTTPKARSEFWNAKFQANIIRDARNVLFLEQRGWRVLVVWECQLKNPVDLIKRMEAFLEAV